MQTLGNTDHAQRWLDQMFATRAAQRGAVVRRSMAWVDREVGGTGF